MQIILLTHERELNRPTNTGQLALNMGLKDCRRILWSRVEPDKGLLALLASGDARLLFPKRSQAMEAPDSETAVVDEGVINLAGDSEFDERPLTASHLPKALVILDATWQEARKMLRQSPYLKRAATCYLQEQEQSSYQLRRNQIPNGLCTIECIIAIYKLLADDDNLARLQQAFRLHNLNSTKS